MLTVRIDNQDGTTVLRSHAGLPDDFAEASHRASLRNGQ
jgi:hypothetical protein